MAVLSKLSNSNRAEWEADGEQRSRCKTFGALKEALERIRASCDPTTCNLSTAFVSSAHLSDQALSSAEPGKSGAPRRAASAMGSLEKV